MSDPNHQQVATGSAPKLGRIVFANQLRGVALLIVLLVHYTVVVQYMRRDVSWVVAAPPLDTPLAPVAAWFYPSRFDLGTLAVALFFLISGFVIPFSLGKATIWRFVAARALRIYPTFWLALLVEWAAVSASAAYWHRSAPYGAHNYMVNGLLIETLAGQQTVDWVSWTLSIEVKFYLLAGLLRPWLVRRLTWPLLLGSALALTANGLAGRGLLNLSVELVSETTYLAFVWIGTLFSYHHAGSITTRRLVLTAAGMMAAVAASWAIGPMQGDWTVKAPSLAGGLMVFGAAYFAQGRFRPNRFLDACAAISYPLYLVHAVFGFAMLSFLMMAWRVPYYVAAAAALAASTVIACILHLVAERPSIRLGARLSKAGPSASASTTRPRRSPLLNVREGRGFSRR